MTGILGYLLGFGLYLYDIALCTRRNTVSYTAKKEVATHSQMPFNWNTDRFMKEYS